MHFLRTIDNHADCQELFNRFARLDPSERPRWGQLTAPAMLVHLCDQMRMPFNDQPSGPIPGVQRYPIMKQLVLYVLPWPKGRIQGPPEAFRTEPGEWAHDLATLRQLVDDFVAAPRNRQWPVHPNFGPLSRQEWGFFCYRHFDHHLRQFGA